MTGDGLEDAGGWDWDMDVEDPESDGLTLVNFDSISTDECSDFEDLKDIDLNVALVYGSSSNVENSSDMEPEMDVVGS